MVALHKDDTRDDRNGEQARNGPQARNGAQARSPARTRVAQPPPAVDLHIVESEEDLPPRVRKDMLPDGADYEDTGCELAKSCLRCPFSTCKYDLIAGGRTLSAEDRDREIAVLREKHHVPIALLVHAYGVSLRTVYRALREYNGGLPKKSEALRRKRELKAAARQLRLQFDVAPRASMTAGRKRKRPERNMNPASKRSKKPRKTFRFAEST